MKTIINRFSLAFVALVGVVSLTACTTTQHRNSIRVCPECKQEERTVESWQGDSDKPDLVSVTEHNCPGCKGPFQTLFSEGSFKHKCHICIEGGTGCPLEHRI